MQDIYGNHQPAGTPGAGQFAPKAGVGSTEAFHRLASIADRAGDERMERGRAARHPLLTRLKGLFRRKPSPTPPLPPKGRGHGVIDLKSSYDRGDGRYDQDFHADEFDRIASSDPRPASDYPNMLRDRFGLGGLR